MLRKDYAIINDSDLIQMVQVGDSEAFTEFYDRFDFYIRQFLRLRFNSSLAREEEDDVVQDTWVKVAVNINRYEHRGIKSWLSKIALREGLNYIRHRKRKSPAYKGRPIEDYFFLMDDSNLLEELLRKEDFEVKLEEIEKLPVKERAALTLQVMGYTLNEICEELNLRESMVSRYLTRAKRSLKG